MLFEPFFREDTYEKDIKSYIKSDKKGESTLDKQKFFSTLLTTVVIILTTFFVLTSDIHIILGAAIVGVGVMVSESLSKKIFLTLPQLKQWDSEVLVRAQSISVLLKPSDEGVPSPLLRQTI